MNSGLCKDSNLWGFDNPEETPSIDLCGQMGVDDKGSEAFISSGCIAGRAFLCNALPSVDYVCIEDKSYDNLIAVLGYDYFYQYSSNDISYGNNMSHEIQWNENAFYWDYYKNGTREGYCEPDVFTLPQKCSNWQFLDSNETVSFTNCPCLLKTQSISLSIH